MTLHRKIVVLLFAGITLYTIVGFLFNQFLILPNFEALEHDEARKDMRRCQEALEGQIDRIDLLCFDWAAWDDTYEFIVDPNEDYRDSNLIPESFIDNRISFIYFFRTDGTILWGAFYDLEEETQTPFADFEDRLWKPDCTLLDHSGRASKVKGIISTSVGPALISSRPILPSEATEDEVVRGTLVMGRVLDSDAQALIRERTQVTVELLDALHTPLPPGGHHLKTDEIRIIEARPTELQVFSHFHDIEGKDAIVLQVTVPRTILARGTSAIRFNMLAVGIAGFCFLLILLVSLKWVVTDPLDQLSAHVSQVHLAGGEAPAGLLHRRDEIGELSRAFSSMLKRLHEEEAELVTAEAALRTSEARIRTILNTAPDAILTIHTDGSIESANGAAERLFGYTIDEMAGMDSATLFARDCEAIWLNLLETCRAKSHDVKAVFDAEALGLRRNGTAFPVHVNVSSVRLDGALYFICDLRDISGMKAMREKVARSQHLATIGEMGASVAHEIRNPLAGIKGALQVFSTGTLSPDEAGETIGAIRELVDRIAHTVDQLLTYAKPIAPRLDSLNLRSAIEAASINPPSGTRVEVVCDGTLEAKVDPQLFQQVLENIWRNACQAVKPPGKLEWRVAQSDDAIEIQLHNDGDPVPDGALAHVFDPFFTTRVDGSGLGLSVSLRIIEAHGGTMSLGNVGKQGVSVTVRLPIGV